MMGVSPTRPSYLPHLPPVEVAAASLPSQSIATAPTVCAWSALLAAAADDADGGGAAALFWTMSSFLQRSS